MKHKRAAVLSGGSVRGSWQVGALRKTMVDDGIDYSIIVGVSVGAINAAVLSQEPFGHPELAWLRLARAWDDLDDAAVKRRWRMFGKLAGFWKQSLFNAEPLEKSIIGRVDREKIIASGRTVTIGAVDLGSGEYVTVGPENERFVDWLYASASVPCLFQPGKIDGREFIDGGIRNIVPIADAIMLGADEIDVYVARPALERNWSSMGKNAIEVAERALEIAADEIVSRDIETVRLRMITAQDSVGINKEPVIRILRPSAQLLSDGESSLDFSRDTIRRLIEIGHSDACAGWVAV